MNFSNDIYIDDSINELEYIIESLQNSITIDGVYLLCINANMNNLFEIMESKEIFKPKNKANKYLIIGISMNLDSLVLNIKSIFENYIEKNIDILRLKETILTENNFND